MTKLVNRFKELSFLMDYKYNYSWIYKASGMHFSEYSIHIEKLSERELRNERERIN